MSYQNSGYQSEKMSTQNMQSDRPLLIAVIFLVVIGLMAIFSASAPKCIESGVNPARYLIQQLVAVVAGFAGLKFLSNFHYKKLMAYTLPFAFFVIIMLILVKVIGGSVNGAQRWINLGPVNIQPSEFAKPAVVLLLAGVFYRNAEVFDNNKIVTAFIPILIMMGLIFIQPNLSMLLLLLFTSVAIFLCAGGSLQFILTGYNVIQSLVAFATGGFYGVGYGSSKQKLAWLPEAHTDFIYAVIGEEHGFIGCILIICLFWTILQRGFLIASKCQDMYGKLLALGLTFSICFQGFLNMWVASSFVPATGVPMPFISYGGSSIMVSLCMVGILLNISKDNVKRMRNYTNVRNI